MATQIWADGLVGELVGADAWGINTIVACDRSRGSLVAINVLTGKLDLVWHGDGYDSPIGISVRGDTALITEQSGTLLVQDLLQPGRAGATEVATGIGELHQVCRSADEMTAFVADRIGGRIVGINLADSTVYTVVAGLSEPVGLAVALDGTFYVAEQASGSLLRIAPDGSRTTLAQGLASPKLLSWADSGRNELLITERQPANRVGSVDLSQNPTAVVPLVRRSIEGPGEAIVIEDRLVITGSQRLLAFDISQGLHGTIVLEPAELSLWPTAWSDIEVNTGVTGYLRQDLTVSIDPPTFGAVSAHLPAGTDPGQTTFRLLAGATAGSGDIVVRDITTNAELNRTPLTIAASSRAEDGPAQWIDGPTGPPPLMRALTLTPGVDDAGLLGQRLLRNLDGSAKRAWNVLAVLVDTGTSVWFSGPGAAANPPTVATARTAWTNFIPAVQRYWSEVSGGRLTVNLVNNSVYGPVHLGESWAHWMEESDGHWDIKEGVCDTVVTVLRDDATIDWSRVDSLLLIVRSTGADFVWPTASVGKTAATTTPRNSFLPVPLARMAVPHEFTNPVTWPLPDLGFTTAELLCHELGHNLGLRDLYMNDPDEFTAEMIARDLGALELMSDQSDFPHLSARNKSLLGFLDAGRIRSFTYGVAETVTVTLQASSDNTSPPIGPAAIELRVAPKKSWFFEFRQNIVGAVGDQSGAVGGGVIVGYDADNYSDPPTAPFARTPIILLANDDDAEGAVLTVGDDYVALNDNADGPAQFSLEVLAINPTSATVRVTVGTPQWPDPTITSAPGNGDFRSPDIEVRPDIPGLDPAWQAIPRADVNNTIIAKVTNAGALDAPNVTVRFSVRNFNTDDPSSNRWQSLGEPVVADVAAGTTVDFLKEGWRPENPWGHYCVQARIDRYVNVAGALADEPDIDNNLAQSNYTFMFSVALSPASRESSLVEVRNPYPFPATAAIELRQDVAGYRSYVDHRWIRLEPDETRHVLVEVESTATSVEDILEHRYPKGRTWIRAWFRGNHNDHVNHTGTGVTLDVSTAVGTQITQLAEKLDGAVLFQVESVSGGFTPPGGTVLLRIEYEDGSVETMTGPIGAAGVVRLAKQPRPGRGIAFFSGTDKFAPCQIDVVLPGGQ